MSDFFDAYFEKKIDETIQTELYPLFKIPGDKDIIRKWMAKLFDKCVKDSNNIQVLVALCKLIIERNPDDFSFNDASQVFEQKVIEEFEVKVGELGKNVTKTFEIAYFDEFLETGLISKKGTINIWDSALKLTNGKFNVVPSFMKIMESSINYVRNVNEDTMIEKLKIIRENLKPFLYKKELSEYRSKIRWVLKYIGELQSVSYPKFELNTESYEEIDKSFVEMVDTTINDDAFYGLNFKMLNPKVDAKFYFDHAVQNMHAAKTFGPLLTYILPNNDEASQQFKTEISELCETRFVRQHSKATRAEYSDEEILSTNHFICELLVKRYITDQKGEKFLKVIKNQKDDVLVSSSCTALMILAMTAYKLPDFNKKYT